MDPSDAQLRKDLKAASENVRRQIEVQNRVRYSRGGSTGGDDIAIAALQNMLDQLEEALANLASPKAPGP